MEDFNRIKNELVETVNNRSNQVCQINEELLSVDNWVNTLCRIRKRPILNLKDLNLIIKNSNSRTISNFRITIMGAYERMIIEDIDEEILKAFKEFSEIYIDEL